MSVQMIHVYVRSSKNFGLISIPKNVVFVALVILSILLPRLFYLVKKQMLLNLRLIHMLNRSEEHTSELQSHSDLVCRLLLEKKKKAIYFSRITSVVIRRASSPGVPPGRARPAPPK